MSWRDEKRSRRLGTVDLPPPISPSLTNTVSTHVIGSHDNLDDILRVLVQDFYCGSRYEGREILCKGEENRDGVNLLYPGHRNRNRETFKENKYLIDNVQAFCHCKDEEDVVLCQLLAQKSQRRVVLQREGRRDS